MNQTSCCHPGIHLLACLRGKAQAAASIAGSPAYPAVSGLVRFFQTSQGVLVCAEIRGLPQDGPGIFGFHIHEGRSCGGHTDPPFSEALGHYGSGPHPLHAGDLPPLFASGGLALAVFLTGRFSVEEITGRTVMVHRGPDDFTSQPAGGSGERIACGVIRGPRC